MNNKIKVTFGERLRDLREERGYTLDELEEALTKKNTSISHTTLGKYENDADIKLSYLKILANFYNVDIDYLLGYTNTRRKDVTHKVVSTKFGLSDKAMNRLENMKRDFFRSEKLEIINYMLESPLFVNVILERFTECCKNKATNNKQNLEVSEFNISREIIELIDNYYNDVYPHNDNNGNNLMNTLEKINKKNKKKK